MTPPGRSALNRIERKIASLSHELSGVIFPRDHCGSHLDDQRRTIDLELRNFQNAGEVLADVSSPLVVDGHPAVAEYIQLHQSKLPVEKSLKKPQSWTDRHVRMSQYFTQVVKGSESEYCSPSRSSYFKIMDTYVLPAPLSMTYTSEGVGVQAFTLNLRRLGPSLLDVLSHITI